MLKQFLVLRSPEADAGGGTAAPVVGAAKAAAVRTAAPKTKAVAAAKPGAKAPAKTAASAASKPVGERGGALDSQNVPESAADRALARKQASDADARRTAQAEGVKGMKKPEKPAKGAKVQSLADIKKKHSSNVEQPIETEVEVDPEALPNPKMEAGRPDPEVKSRRRADPEGETVAREDEPEVQALATDESSAEVTEPLEGEPPVEGEETVEEFVAKTKFTAYGKEHDIPEMFHSLMTTPETERTVHDVFERAQAFDKTKERLAQVDQYFQQEIAPELTGYRQTREELVGMAKERDLFALASKFGFSENDILHLASERLSILESGPEEKRRHAELQRSRQEQRESARRIAELENKSMESAQLAKRTAFESVLARDDIQALAKEIDEKMGSQGYFARSIWQHGKQVYKDSAELARMGRGHIVDLAPEDAVKDFMRVNGLSFPEAPATTTSAKGAAAPAKGKAAAQATATPAPKPKIIPNLGTKPSGTPSGARPVVNSIKDIERIRKEKYGR